ncbi:hypothetical protein ZYGR_0AD03780 [Zygosaccharomyces rouxii]|uniref:ZYRO0G14872p n=2 Tax=Zygosaccharomyces rouxii TaxID=4956 RepID=C5E0R0_ZYGRC|nr:uncharacterized protein ZYRO0G14872g [Zygosaccharomyces rouxii]KAH9202688.1 hypothetical protein LQ764DRAFT_207651 [Zygosaccharomyces rouxii]GAV51195.1 hypothetical protein ZYGR_0AD03780 [Zygosaccharomyces rouxii]CAR29694.1 ZYRO0G14872p [Zygosaccharomyces rouxii]
MDIGIPLSQLASQHPISTGCEPLDSSLEGGFKPGCIYEIYGPPGSCKEILLKNVLNSSSRDRIKNKKHRNLVIQTHKPILYSRLGNHNNHNNTTYTTRITKFSQLLRFLQLREDKGEEEQKQHKQDYTVLVIDGFAQLLVDHTNFSRRSTAATTATITTTPNAGSDYTTKRLNLLLSVLTRYATRHHTIVILVNHSMVIQREHSPNPNTSSNFLVTNALKKGVLTSALEWGNALSGKDAIGSRLLKFRLGLFWDWDRNSNNSNHKGSTTCKHISSRRPTIVVLQGGGSRPDGKLPEGTGTTTSTIAYELNDSDYGYYTDDDNDVFAVRSYEDQQDQQRHQQRELEVEHTTIQDSQ